MADAASFAKMVPGFDFLQGLVKNAGAALPSMGQWVAPTLNPEELEKRIEELKTVQFWLEQNARMLGATIQALEVQRMTLSTLKTMNVSMGELREAMTIKAPEAPAASQAKPAPEPAAAASSTAKPTKAAEPPASAVDPMQWWGALTKQFTELAATAMKDSATDAARNLAGNMVKQSFEAANDTLKKGMSIPTAAVKSVAGVAGKAASRVSRAAAAAPAKKVAAPKRAAAKRAPRKPGA